MRLHVNGSARQELEVSTVGELLARLGLAREGVAVAVNGAVVPRSEHANSPLRDGDRVEVIQAVGGG